MILSSSPTLGVPSGQWSVSLLGVSSGVADGAVLCTSSGKTVERMRSSISMKR